MTLTRTIRRRDQRKRLRERLNHPRRGLYPTPDWLISEVSEIVKRHLKLTNLFARKY